MGVLSNGVTDWAPELRDVRVDGTVLRVAQQGTGRPLLLVNGLGANLEMWRPVAEHLPGRRVVMFDAPGTGASPRLQRHRTMRGLAELVEGLLDALGLERVDVLGYSWGGALSQQLARQAPHRVSALVLGATMCGLGGHPPMPWVSALMMSPLRYYSRSYLRFVAPLVFGSTPSSAADSPHGDARVARPPSMVGYAQQLLAVGTWSSRPWLHELRVPTLVLTGSRDPLVPSRNGYLLARGIAGAQLQVVDGGHLFLLEQPARACRLVTQFLDETARAEP